MSWQQPIQDVRQAHIRATQAEQSQRWHVAVQQYLYCFEQAHEASDDRAVRFFAAKLCRAYQAMAMAKKAAYYRAIAE